jgi:hypothetical protein
MVTHTNCSMHVLITRIVILKALVARIVIFNDKYIYLHILIPKIVV